MTRLTTQLTRSGLCAIATAWLGCALDDGTQSAETSQRRPDDPGEAPGASLGDAHPATTSSEQILLSFHHEDGSTALGGVFTSKDEVHLRTRVAPGSGPFAGGVFAFVVVDRNGQRLSADALGCRRFIIAPGGGGIAEVQTGIDISGAPCQHAWGVHWDGSLIPELATFADAPVNDEGFMEYTVLVALVDKIAGSGLPYDGGVFPPDAYRATFVIQSMP
jgi:hypothetical protein